MITRLPNAESAVLDIRKLADYCLNGDHPRGRHKARVFRTALGIGPDDANELRDLLLDGAKTAPATLAQKDGWGEHWRIDVTVARQNRRAVVRSLWIIRTGEAAPRFVTCWIS